MQWSGRICEFLYTSCTCSRRIGEALGAQYKSSIVWPNIHFEYGLDPILTDTELLAHANNKNVPRHRQTTVTRCRGQLHDGSFPSSFEATSFAVVDSRLLSLARQ